MRRLLAIAASSLLLCSCSQKIHTTEQSTEYQSHQTLNSADLAQSDILLQGVNITVSHDTILRIDTMRVTRTRLVEIHCQTDTIAQAHTAESVAPAPAPTSTTLRNILIIAIICSAGILVCKKFRAGSMTMF